MKSLFQKIISPLLALLVLFSTMSFTVDMHFCGGTLVDKAIFSEVKKCGMEMYSNQNTSNAEIKKPGCCEDITIEVEGQEELKVSLEKHELQTLQFAILFSHSYLSLFEPLSEKHIPFEQYSPPKLIEELHILNETYLI